MKKLVGVVALVLASSNVFAADFFVGLHYAQSSNDDFCKDEYFGESNSCDDDASGNKLAVGFQFNDYFALELSKIDSGEFVSKDAYYEDLGGGDFFSGNAKISGEVTGLSLAAQGFLPVNDSFAFFAKAGLLSWKSKMTYKWAYHHQLFGETYTGSDKESDSDNGLSPTYGLGMRLKPSDSVQIVLEWQQLPGIDVDLGEDESFETDVAMTSLGLQFVF